MQKKVLLAFDDPGGGLAVSSLIGRLKAERKIIMSIYSGKLSEKFLEEMEIDFNRIDSNITSEIAENIISKVDPDILVTATGGGNAEQELRNIAYEKEIPSVVILDFWKDYSRRWLYATYPLEKMKDKVCVMDELTKKEMMEENFPEDKLIITGHPYLDKLFNHSYYKGMESKYLNNYLFLSQPLEIIGLKNYKVHPLKVLLNVLTKLAEEKKEKISLNIKFHPSEKHTSEINDLVSEYFSENLEINFTNENRTLKNLLEESNEVIGYSSIALFEARAMDKRVISLNVAPVKNSLTQSMKMAGIEIVSANENEILSSLKAEHLPELKRNIFKGGIENIARVISNELNLN